jgi:hypothetical protein
MSFISEFFEGIAQCTALARVNICYRFNTWFLLNSRNRFFPRNPSKNLASVVGRGQYRFALPSKIRSRRNGWWHPLYAGLQLLVSTRCNLTRARIGKRLRSPEIYSKEPILPAYVAWRAGMSKRVVVPAHQTGNLFLGSLKGLQIRALVHPIYRLNQPEPRDRIPPLSITHGQN